MPVAQRGKEGREGAPQKAVVQTGKEGREGTPPKADGVGEEHWSCLPERQLIRQSIVRLNLGRKEGMAGEGPREANGAQTDW